MEEIFKNYDAFYNMLISTTIMSNSQTEQLKADARRIIEFIGKAYRLGDDLIEKSIYLIFEKLGNLGLTTDQQAVYGGRVFGDNYSDEDVLLDIKGDVLAKLQSLRRTNNPEINEGWFDYSHYKTYQADVRFSKINKASASGNIITTRQIGILCMLGIGCEVNVNLAQKRLLQCVFWGDIPSMYYLAYSYRLAGNDEKSKLFYELSELATDYLYAGYTVLPETAKQKYSKTAQEYYAYVSTIKQDIVYAYNAFNVDFSFVEAITAEEQDYYKIMEYINNYRMAEWRELTNSSQKPPKKLGFR